MPGFRLPPRGTQAQRDLREQGDVRVGEGQPEAASIEPAPLEVAEQLRGERDDVIRESMAAQALEGRSEGFVTGFGERELSALGDSCLKLYRLLSGQYSFEELLSGVVKNEVAEQLVGSIDCNAGKLFIIRRMTVLAPKGCKLRLYKNNVAAGNLVEVVTNVQEFAGEIPGTIRLRGKERLVATVIGCEAAGTVAIEFEGDLVNEEDLPW